MLIRTIVAGCAVLLLCGCLHRPENLPDPDAEHTGCDATSSLGRDAAPSGAITFAADTQVAWGSGGGGGGGGNGGGGGKGGHPTNCP
ncbi:MAG TPA: hypothetical protein VHE77_20630 [Dongiaceae bacterium]|jgi:hypothetical protein|nr:hypothetical protein [Dongiaceae bacterium]